MRAMATESWIELAGGWFWMGGGPGPDEGPRHRVCLASFQLATTPVTRASYQEFVANTGHPAPADFDDPRFRHPEQPAVGLSWHDAIAFCAFVTDRDQRPTRLPTEAEWEFAALAGRENALYPWGDAPPESLPDYHTRWLDGPETVDRYPSSHPLGFVGLGENIHEWCSDWYAADYYETSPSHDPQGPGTGHRKSSRGGAWRHSVKVSRCAARSSIPPDRRYNDYGIRLARSIP